MSDKLTDAQVVAIRRRRAAGEEVKPLAAEYSVSPTTISRLWIGKLRRAAGGPLRPDPETLPHGVQRCRHCRKVHVAAQFYPVKRVRKDGTRSRDSWCKTCRNRDNNRRKAANRTPYATPRRKRINGHGDIWCPNCTEYLHPDHFRFPPCHKGRPAPYCKDCTRELSRLGHKQAYANPERRDRVRQRNVANQRRRREKTKADRIDFIQGGFATLRGRGLTRGEIGAVLGLSPAGRYKIELGQSTPTPNVAERVRVALAETADWPKTPAPIARRNTPPHIARLIARMAPVHDAYPLRNVWINRKKGPTPIGKEPQDQNMRSYMANGDRAAA